MGVGNKKVPFVIFLSFPHIGNSMKMKKPAKILTFNSFLALISQIAQECASTAFSLDIFEKSDPNMATGNEIYIKLMEQFSKDTYRKQVFHNTPN